MMSVIKLGNEDGKVPRYAVDEAVLLLQNWFARKAVRMSKDNVSLVDDLIQEMSMGVLLCVGENTLSFYRQRACFRARDFLRTEQCQDRKKERYSLLSIPISEDGDEAFIEGLIDLEDRMSTRAERMDRITDYYPERRASA